MRWLTEVKKYCHTEGALHCYHLAYDNAEAVVSVVTTEKPHGLTLPELIRDLKAATKWFEDIQKKEIEPCQ